mgnify:FL=1
MSKERTRHIDIRFGTTKEDQLAWDILHRHEGYATMAAYVKAVVIAYDKQTRLRPEALAQTKETVEERKVKVEQEETELDAMLNIIARC